MLTVCRTGDAPPFTPEEVDTIASFGAQAGLGMELARIRQAREADRLATEREQIAHRLNQDVLDELLRISSELDGLAGRARDPGQAHDLVRNADRVHRAARTIATAVLADPPRSGTDRPD